MFCLIDAPGDGMHFGKNLRRDVRLTFSSAG